MTIICEQCGYETRPGIGLVPVAPCEAHRPNTQQENRLIYEVWEVFEREAQRQDAFVCRGFGMGFSRDIQALVRKALDDVCHGATIRQDDPYPEPSEYANPNCETCLGLYTIPTANGSTTCPVCVERRRQEIGFYDRLGG